MRVICRNIFNEITKKYQDQSPHLTIGKEYIVLEIYINPSKNVKYRIFNNDGYTPGLFDSKQFEIISDKIPSTWIIREINSFITLTTKAWSKSGYWEDYFDMLPEARSIFERELKYIFSEEAD